ncbi:helitron_like_N domain-containing protein [Trichonephila inaurata madagascariensis]|uniref:Helitron_like_N domain-containing protein n=1 Tax=Trichonephila inaurata madagascariensis TaxID=2747483 RepID=A0A8X6WX06_9ARAC|nr:helitron_like_N domain-containing protein [Trichonephila inaurata madagascariensis]
MFRGVLNANSQCIVDGVCTKGYPKKFSETTAENFDGYPMYRLCGNAKHAVTNGSVVDNRSLLALWEEFKSYLSEDFEFHTIVQQGVNLALHNIAKQLHSPNMTLMNNGLSEPTISNAGVKTEFYILEA